jgi:hypothetical protein
MARIAGIDIPKNKHINIALRYIYGIGPALSLKVLDKAKIDPEIIADALSEDQVNRLRDIIDHEFTVEGELRRTSSVFRRSAVTAAPGIAAICRSGDSEPGQTPEFVVVSVRLLPAAVVSAVRRRNKR